MDGICVSYGPGGAREGGLATRGDSFGLPRAGEGQGGGQHPLAPMRGRSQCTVSLSTPSYTDHEAETPSRGLHTHSQRSTPGALDSSRPPEFQLSLVCTPSQESRCSLSDSGSPPDLHWKLGCAPRAIHLHEPTYQNPVRRTCWWTRTFSKKTKHEVAESLIL